MFVSHKSFRLSPAEQETAYELKATMFRKLEEQTARVDAEIQIHQSLQQAQLARSKSAGAYHNQMDMSRANALKLMKLYEKQAVKGCNIYLSGLTCFTHSYDNVVKIRCLWSHLMLFDMLCV